MKKLLEPVIAVLVSLAVMVSIGVFNPPISFNPLISSRDLSSAELGTLLFEPLINRIEPLKFLPQLAESFDTTDKQTYTIKLNPNAKWTDGTPVTTEDVAIHLR
ncbi:ABC transporter substrate-binding protein [Brevibacillus centrosporus]|uniref:ABC transporter substrate-binding protein n=1 Tax=Brevibacillus centrosporus TaxID=54910 RepID=UPI003D246724